MYNKLICILINSAAVRKIKRPNIKTRIHGMILGLRAWKFHMSFILSFFTYLKNAEYRLSEKKNIRHVR